MTHPHPPLPKDTVVWSDPLRKQQFKLWLASLPAELGLQTDSLALASADASFRRYLRIQGRDGPLIIMDAPPPQEDVRPFVQIGRMLLAAGLHVPELVAQEPQLGFLLLEDLGNDLYLKGLQTADTATADRWMRDAISALVVMQSRVDASLLPNFDRALLQRELDLFPEWCVRREYGVQWTSAQQASWTQLSERLIDSALAQPVVFVHRDWMPRNLMRSSPNPGILDFQDAVRGPITYDIACLLRDAFLSWDEEREIDWAVRWWQEARAAGLPVADDFGECWRQLEWMGMQRHLKVAGIFCRLKHRDGKPAYATDLPRFFNYLTKVAMRYRPLQGMVPLIEALSGRPLQSGLTF